jgi:hypothetical protein
MKDGNSMKRMVLLLAWAILMLVVKTSAASLLRLFSKAIVHAGNADIVIRCLFLKSKENLSDVE